MKLAVQRRDESPRLCAEPNTALDTTVIIEAASSISHTASGRGFIIEAKEMVLPRQEKHYRARHYENARERALAPMNAPRSLSGIARRREASSNEIISP